MDDAHAALMRTVASDGGVAVVGLSVAQARALLDEAARLVAERDAATRERDEARASERDACSRYLRAMAQTYRDYHTNEDAVMPVAAEIEKLATEIAEEAHSEWRREREGDFELIDGMVLARLSDARDALRALLDEAVAVIHGEFCHGEDHHHPTCAHFRARRAEQEG